MTFDRFVVEMQADIELFKRYWFEGNKLDPNMFPLELSPGDWQEQFTLFLDTTPDRE